MGPEEGWAGAEAPGLAEPFHPSGSDLLFPLNAMTEACQVVWAEDALVWPVTALAHFNYELCLSEGGQSR